jgi:endonuclease YncB( thermonuclease family)
MQRVMIGCWSFVYDTSFSCLGGRIEKGKEEECTEIIQPTLTLLMEEVLEATSFKCKDVSSKKTYRIKLANVISYKKDHKWGQKAKEFTQQKFPFGTEILVKANAKEQGKIIGNLYYQKKDSKEGEVMTDFQEELLNEGLASVIPESAGMTRELGQAEQEAIDKKIGMWADEKCIEIKPLDSRKNRVMRKYQKDP